MKPNTIPPAPPKINARSGTFLRNCLLIGLMAGSAIAQTVPDLTNGGVPNHTSYINLGPTGLTGWVYREKDPKSLLTDLNYTGSSRQIKVTAVAAGSPAVSAGILADDVILGASGDGSTPVDFTSDARKSLALAIAAAEARTTPELKLKVWRAGVISTYTLTLQNLGAYGPGAPISDAKCALIVANARQALLANSNSGGFGLGTLALMALDEPNHPDHAAMKAQIDAEITAMLPDAATLANMNSGIPEASDKVAWHRGHRLIVLAEYYLTYGEHPSGGVFQAIEGHVNSITTGQSIFGTFGHIYAQFRWPDGATTPMMSGYGAINSSAVPGMYGLMLAKQCNVINPKLDEGINRALTFYGSYAGRGCIPYGEHEPASSEYSSNGKSGSASLAFDLAAGKQPESKYFAKMSAASFKEFETGHSGSYFQHLWSPLGAAHAGDDAIKTYFAELSWLYDLARKWDGSFAYTPIYTTNNYTGFNNSVPFVMTYALPLKRLHMTGRGRSATGVLDATERAQAVDSGNYDETTRTKAQLIADLGDWSPVVQLRASTALGGMTLTSTDINTLHALASDPIGASRVGALLALETVADPSSAPVLSACLSDPDPHIRRLAGNALLANPGKAGELNVVLSAAAAAQRPTFPMDPRDPLHHDLYAIGKVLFTGNNDATKRGILYSSSLLKVDLTGVDRNLLYPAIRATAGCPAGVGRSGMSGAFDALDETDVKVLGDILVDTAFYRAPADPMFADTARAKAMDALGRYDFAEAIPVAERSIRADFFINPNRTLYGDMFRDLQQFGRTNLLVTPDPEILDLCQDFIAKWGVDYYSGDNAAEAAILIDAINYDSHPAAPKYLKSFNWVVTDAVQLTLPANQTQLHASVTDHAKGDLTYTWRKVYGAGGVTFSANGTAASKDTTITFDNTPGNYLFEVAVIDSRGLSEIKGTVAMTLYDAGGNLPANLPPTAAPQSVTAAPGTLTPITLAGSDPENAPLVFTVSSQPQYGTLSGTAPNLTYITDLSYHTGQDSFTFSVTDSFGQTSSATVSITVDVSLLVTRVHEPFDYPAGALLTGNAGGTGMTGTWLDGPTAGKAWIYDATTVTTPVNTGHGTYSWDGVVDNLPTHAESGVKMVGLGAATGGDSYEIHRPLAQNAGTMAGADKVLWASIAYHRESSSFAQHLGLALTTDCFTNSGRQLDVSGNHGSGAGDGIGVGRPTDVASSYRAVVFDGGSAIASTTAAEFGSGDFVMVLKFEFGVTDKVSAYAFREHEIIRESEFEARAVMATAAIDESTLNRISVACGRGDPSFDEIRVGDSFAAVVGVAESNVDVTPPAPNPMTFAVAPTANATAITMTATSATDPSGVEYFFTCTSGGGKNSGWQDSPSYTDSSLNTGTGYTYTVMARDKSVNLNVTAPSAPASATTAADVALVYEAFDYPVGELLGRNGGNGFAGAWADSAGTSFQGYVRDETTNVIFDSTTLDWDGVLNNGFPSSPSPGSRYLSSDGQLNSGVDVKRTLASNAGAMAGADGVLWMSAVYRFPNSASGASINIGLTDGGNLTDRGRRTSSTTMDFIGVNGWNGSSTWNAQVNPTIIDTTTATNYIWDQYARTVGGVNMNSTVDKIIVMKFTFGASDKVEAFWFDENTPMGSITEAAFNTGRVGATYAAGINENNLNTLVYSQGRFNNALDEIRIGNSLEEVIGLAGSTTPDTTPPTLASSNIVDDQGGGPITPGSVVVYNVTFSEDITASTVTPSDFSNAGTASGTIGTIVAVSPATYQVRFNALSTGTLQLRVNAGAVITDLAGNPLNTSAAIPDDTIISVTPANFAPVWAVNPLTEVSATEDVAYSSTLANDATDADNNPLAFTKVSGPAWLTVASNGALGGTPANSDVGANIFTVSVTDNIAPPVEATLHITVINTNDAPVAMNGSAATNEDTGVAITLVATDVDSAIQSYTVVSGPAKGTLSGTAPNLTYTPNANTNGADSFTFKASDGALDSNVATISITVNAVNDAPVALADTASTTVDEPVAITLAATDIDSTIQGFTVVTSPGNGTLSGTAPNLTYTPGVGYTGPDSFTFTANDGSLDSNVATITITVTEPPPSNLLVYEPFNYSVGRLTGLNGGTGFSTGWVNTNGTGSAGYVYDQTANVVFDSTTQNWNGVLNNGFPTSPGPGSRYLGAEALTSSNLDVGRVMSASAGVMAGGDGVLWMSVVYHYANTAFGAGINIGFTDGGYVYDRGRTLTGATTDFIGLSSWNGSTTWNPRVQPTIVDSASANGSSTWTSFAQNTTAANLPTTKDHIIVLKFTFGASDKVEAFWFDEDTPLASMTEAAFETGKIGTTYATGINENNLNTLIVSQGRFNNAADEIRVGDSFAAVVGQNDPVNNAPVALNGSVSTSEDTAVAVTLSATDAEGPVQSYTVIDGPNNGTLGGIAPNLTYTPNADYNGADSFTFKANDGTLDSNIATVSITVSAVNDAPVASNGSASTTEDTPVAVALVATDIDNAIQSYTVVSGPSMGTLSGTAPNLTYTPNANTNGADSFTFRANDGTLDSNLATVSITVSAVNDAPVASNGSASTPEDTPVAVALVATDIDNAIQSYTLVSGPAKGTLSGTAPNLTYTPNANTNGADSFTFKANDGTLDSNIATFSLTVTAVNDVPVFAVGSIIAADASEGTAYTGVTLAGQASDPDAGDTITFSKVSGPTWLVVAPDGALSGTPPSGSAGLNSFVVRATDSASATADATLEITVSNLPLPWITTDIGTGMLAGSTSFSAGTFTQAGSGVIGGTSDSLRYTYQTLSGDGEIIARISSLQNTGSSSRVGVMIRDTLASNSKEIFMGMTNSNAYRWVRRTATEGSTTSSNSNTGTVPNTWVRLVRSGTTITAYKSTNGTSWTTVGSTTNTTFASTCYIGIAVGSGSNTTLNTSQFSNVSVTP